MNAKPRLAGHIPRGLTDKVSRFWVIPLVSTIMCLRLRNVPSLKDQEGVVVVQEVRGEIIFCPGSLRAYLTACVTNYRPDLHVKGIFYTSRAAMPKLRWADLCETY